MLPSEIKMELESIREQVVNDKAEVSIRIVAGGMASRLGLAHVEATCWPDGVLGLSGVVFASADTFEGALSVLTMRLSAQKLLKKAAS